MRARALERLVGRSGRGDDGESCAASLASISVMMASLLSGSKYDGMGFTHFSNEKLSFFLGIAIGLLKRDENHPFF